MKHKCFLTLMLAAGLMNAAVASAACDINLSDAQVDYGQMTRGDLVSRAENSLSSSELRIGDERELNIMISCDRPTPMTLQFIGPTNDGDSYRFGERGRAELMLHDVMIDNRQVEIVRADKRDVKMAFSGGNVLSFWKEGGPATGTILRGKVTVTAWMPSDATHVKETHDWKLEGNFVTGSSQ